MGGLHAFLQHAIRLSFFKREVSEANFKLFALAFQTIYDTTTKRAHNSTRCVIHYAMGNLEEEGATLKLTHGETALSFERSLASNPAESLPQPGVGLWTAAIHETISERRRTTIVGTGMKIGGLLPNDLGNRGSPIDGINNAFFIPFHNLSGYRPISAVGHRLSLKPLCNRTRHASFAQFSPAPR